MLIYIEGLFFRFCKALCPPPLLCFLRCECVSFCVVACVCVCVGANLLQRKLRGKKKCATETMLALFNYYYYYYYHYYINIINLLFNFIRDSLVCFSFSCLLFREEEEEEEKMVDAREKNVQNARARERANKE